MGQGEEVKTRSESKVEIQERGEIFFFYRPKVNKEEAHSADDVQRLYIVLRPESGERSVEEKQASDSGKEGEKDHGKGERDKKVEHEGGHGSEVLFRNHQLTCGVLQTKEVNIEKQPLLRFIVMGRKSLPDPKERSHPYWGTTKIEGVKLALKGEEYDTAARGHRHQSAARALAEGVCRILRHPAGRKMHTHLVYKLEFPPKVEDNEPQESLNIEREGSFLIQIKNPEQQSSGSFRGLQSKGKATFPASLQGRFGWLRYSPADPPDYLNYEGCEFLLIAASDDIDEELGVDLKTEGEEGDTCSDLIEMFGETASTKPMLSGVWV